MSIRIGLGTGLGATLAPPDYWRWVDYCEENGVDSIWHSDQLLGPTPEPLALLAALAARTSRMRFGSNALVVPFRDPVLIAKQLAAIEYLGAGRLFPVLGVGIASDPYWAATGTSAQGRGGRANEGIALMRRLLQDDEVEFNGAHFQYCGPGVTPRPARAIPLWIGGNSKAAVERTATLGDGWLGSLASAEEAGAVKRRIEAALERTGRTIDADHYGMSLFMRIGDPEDTAVLALRKRLGERLGETQAHGSDCLAVGTPDQIAATFRRYVAQGMSKFVVLPIAAHSDDLMHQTRVLVEEVAPQVENRSG